MYWPESLLLIFWLIKNSLFLQCWLRFCWSSFLYMWIQLCLKTFFNYIQLVCYTYNMFAHEVLGISWTCAMRICPISWIHIESNDVKIEHITNEIVECFVSAKIHIFLDIRISNFFITIALCHVNNHFVVIYTIQQFFGSGVLQTIFKASGGIIYPMKI